MSQDSDVWCWAFSASSLPVSFPPPSLFHSFTNYSTSPSIRGWELPAWQSTVRFKSKGVPNAWSAAIGQSGDLPVLLGKLPIWTGDTKDYISLLQSAPLQLTQKICEIKVFNSFILPCEVDLVSIFFSLLLPQAEKSEGSSNSLTKPSTTQTACA